MATHSSILAWRIPWTKEPGKLQSIGSHRVRQTVLCNIELCNRKIVPFKFIFISSDYVKKEILVWCLWFVVQSLSHVWLCNTMGCSTPGLPVPHHLPEFAQVHVHRISDAIQPSHPVALFSLCLQYFPASGSFPMSPLFASGSQIIEASASVLPMSIQGWFPLGPTGLNSLQSKWLSRVFSGTTVWKHQFFGALPSLWFNCHIYTWLPERPYSLYYMDLCGQGDVFAL